MQETERNGSRRKQPTDVESQASNFHPERTIRAAKSAEHNNPNIARRNSRRKAQPTAPCKISANNGTTQNAQPATEVA